MHPREFPVLGFAAGSNQDTLREASSALRRLTCHRPFAQRV